MPNQNILAVILGGSLIVLGSFAAYVLQRCIFAKYRGKVRNTLERGD